MKILVLYDNPGAIAMIQCLLEKALGKFTDQLDQSCIVFEICDLSEEVISAIKSESPDLLFLKCGLVLDDAVVRDIAHWIDENHPKVKVVVHTSKKDGDARNFFEGIKCITRFIGDDFLYSRPRNVASFLQDVSGA